MTILDRYILRSLTLNYVISVVVMLSLYILLDLFFNMDEFTEQGISLSVVADVVRYYVPNLFLYFSQIAGVVALFACLVTLARMRRVNELVAMLASGVSLHRVAAPILGFGLAVTAVWLMDTEIIIPHLAHRLARRHDDVRGTRTYGVWFVKDRRGALLSAQQFVPSTGRLKRLLIMFRDDKGRVDRMILADEAHWEPLPGREIAGRWVLARGMERVRFSRAPGLTRTDEELRQQIVRYYETDLDPEAIQVRQSAQWLEFLSLGQLSRLTRARRHDPAAVQQVQHARRATPLVNLLLLALGIPFFLDRRPGSILTDAAKALTVCGLCFVTTFVGHHLLRSEQFPALPAWLPIIIFAPVGVLLVDRIRT